MKIAFDVDVLAKQMDINRMVHQVADWGYKYIEQSPHPRINPFYKHPLFSKECEQEYRQALKETGVEISSFIGCTAGQALQRSRDSLRLPTGNV